MKERFVGKMVLIFLILFVAMFFGCSNFNHTKVVAGNSSPEEIQKRLNAQKDAKAVLDTLLGVPADKKQEAELKLLDNTVALSSELANVGEKHAEYYFDGYLTSASDAARLFRATGATVKGGQNTGEQPFEGTRWIGGRNEEFEKPTYVGKDQVVLPARNLSDKDIRFKDGPWQGIRLKPGTETVEAQYFRANREFRFKAEECDISTDNCEEIECRVFIGKGRTEPITYKKKK